MNIIEPNVEVVKISDPLKKIEYVARVCTNSYDKITEGSAKPFCEKLLKMGHTSPFEHFRGIVPWEDYLNLKSDIFPYGFTERIMEDSPYYARMNGRDYLACGGDLEYLAELDEATNYITLKFTIDIGISRELIRHRQMSFMEMSTRYVNMKDGIEFIRPLPFDWSTKKLGMVLSGWITLCEQAELIYKHMIEEGCTPQEARTVLPLSTKTVLFVTGMFRQWDDVFALRLAKGAHPSMRYIMEKAKVLVDQERKAVGE